jgi:TatD DNase family protein
LLETDSPYLTPEPYRGKRNHSYYIKYIYDYVFGLNEITEEEIDQNVKEFFNVK